MIFIFMLSVNDQRQLPDSIFNILVSISPEIRKWIKQPGVKKISENSVANFPNIFLDRNNCNLQMSALLNLLFSHMHCCRLVEFYDPSYIF